MDPLEKVLTQLIIEEKAPTPRHVLFVDMLGFRSLTEQHPDPIVWDFSAPDIIASSTSQSAEQLGRFQHVLNMVPFDIMTALRPSHIMMFSDCAFLV